MLLTDSSFGYDEMKRIVINTIKNNQFNQYADIERQVVEYMINNGYVKETNSFSMSHSQGYQDPSENDSNLIREIVWDLIIERVLSIGMNKSNPNWPFLRITKSGIKSLHEEVILHDVDGVISSLRKKIPEIDPVIIMYLGECLNTYKIGALLASSVMLGCAAEKGILLLIDSYTDWLENNNEKSEASKFRQSVGKAIARRFEDFEKSFKAHKTSIPKDMWEDFDIVINSIFTIIRKNRNEIGHPTGNRIEKDELSAWIHVFRTHCSKIYNLKRHFEEVKIN